MSNVYNTIKSTQIRGTNNIGGYSLDVSGASHFTGVVQCDDYISTSKTTFSGSQLITKAYADLNYYTNGSVNLLTNANSWLNNNFFGVSGSPANTTTMFYNNIVMSGSQITGGLTVSGNLTSGNVSTSTLTAGTVNSSSNLYLQSVANNVAIGSATVPTHKVEITGTTQISGAVNCLSTLSATAITASNSLTTTQISSSNNLTVSATNHVYMQPSGTNVNIGSMAIPTRKLEVYGNCLITGNTQVSSNLTVSGDTTLTGIVECQYLIPRGTIIQHCKSNLITGYKLCDGSAISRTTYALLYASIGTTFGIGDGINTFNVPNYKGCFLRGYGENESGTVGQFTGDAIGSLQPNSTRIHTHQAPINPNTFYVSGSGATSVLNSVSINQPTVALPTQAVSLGTYPLNLGTINVNLGSIHLGALGTFSLGSVNIPLGSATIPLGSFDVNLGSILIPNNLSTTSTSVLNSLNTSTFALDTGNVNAVFTDTEVRPINYSVYYHIKY